MSYELPEVWKWEDESESLSGNRPDAGARFEQRLPRGEERFQVYSLGTPNGIKVAVMFEELRELGVEADYDLFLIHIGEGDQFGSDFVEINPNSKIPAMLDTGVEGDLRVFESASILLYLADEFGALIPEDVQGRTEVVNWLFWQIGAAPYVGGGFGHFFSYAPEKLEYPINRFTMETKRQLDLLDKQLDDNAFVAGDEYSVADIAIWPWYGRLVLGDLYDGSAEFLNVDEYENVMEWARRVAERPGVMRGLSVEYKTFKDEE
ncbi:glutathione-dependent disulfide-bond oxidoreductase [Aerococcaceae bacterium DSM 111176]|nr:glutathione-dependent disulfide-bond oxidoreductase [Aerococcaceae bacterium DSM 111176]